MGRNAIGRLAVAAVAVPVAAKALRKVGQTIRARRERAGGSRIGDAFQRAASGLDTIAGRGQPYRR
jgi:hypothetical protein